MFVCVALSKWLLAWHNRVTVNFVKDRNKTVTKQTLTWRCGRGKLHGSKSHYEEKEKYVHEKIR